MKAVVAAGYGPPEGFVVTDLAVPEPGPGQLQVRIAAASINPADIRLPRGDFRDTIALEFPHVPGNDFAGTVTEIGTDVTGFRVGDEIFGLGVPRVLREFTGAARPSLTTGSLAEYAVLEADTPMVALRPATVSVRSAAALATAGLTARAAVVTADPRPGETALVVGATGGVGTALVALLSAAGVHVIATATPADEDLLRELGAADIIGYTQADYPSDVDFVVNAVLPGDGLAGVAGALRPGGRLVTITYPVPRQDWLGRADVDLRFVLDMDGRLCDMREVGELAAKGVLPATISRSYSLADGPLACADFVNRHTTGKLVVTV